MKTNRSLSKTARPHNVNPRVWEVMRKVASEIWDNYERGGKWNRQVLVSCKAFYDMLLDHNGKLILNGPELVRFSQNGHIQSWANELLLEGIHLISGNEFELATNKLQLHVSMSPKSAVGRAKLAEAYLGTGNYSGAVEVLKTAISIDPKRADFLILRARAYSLLDQDEKALNDLNFALLLSKSNAEALALRGSLYLAKGEVKEAIQDLKKSVRLAPSAEYRHLLLKAYLQLDKLPEAYREVRSILAENPFDAEALFQSGRIRIAFRLEIHKAEDDLLMARSLGHPSAEKLLLDHFSPFNKLSWDEAA